MNICINYINWKCYKFISLGKNCYNQDKKQWHA